MKGFEVGGLSVEPGDDGTLRLSGDTVLSPRQVDELRRQLKPAGAEARRHQVVREAVDERRTRLRTAKPRNTNAPTPVERIVIERDGGRCLRCGEHVVDGGRGVAWSIQHRGARGMGGSIRAGVSTAPNLIVLCGSGTTGDHGWVEAHPLLAGEQGWSISRSADPTREPVFVASLGRKVWLTANGRYSDDAPGEVA